jgi:hypothetical protein
MAAQPVIVKCSAYCDIHRVQRLPALLVWQGQTDLTDQRPKL